MDIVKEIEKAEKHDGMKSRMDLLPVLPLEEVADVFTYGANKYAAWNYLNGEGIKVSRLYAATLRHLFAWFRRQNTDPESGKNHLAHAVCCLLMIMQLLISRDVDDRPRF